MTVDTYSLEQATAEICGAATPAKVEWVVRRLRRTEFTGYKAGRKWRMTRADIDTAIETLRPKRVVPSVPAMSGLTRTSARKLMAS